MRGRSTIAAALVLSIAVAPSVADAQKIYWTDSGTDKIQRANLDGSGVEELVAMGLSSPTGIALDVEAGKMYWAETALNKIQRANLDGSNVEDAVTGLNTPRGLTLDLANGKIYWTVASVGDIHRSNLDGSNIEGLIDLSNGHISGIALNLGEGKMYFIVDGLDSIRRANLDGSGAEVLVTEGGSVRGIALDIAAGKMYWTPGNIIKRANLDGTDIETVVTGEGGASGIALDLTAGKMYWTNIFSDKIHRADLDGSNIEDLITTGLVAPHGIALHLSSPTSVRPEPPADKISLYQAYPNPFSPSTTLRFDLSRSASVKLGIYDAAGRRVVELIDEYRLAGPHSIQWNGMNEKGKPAAPGVYFYRLTAGTAVETRKMILLR